MKRIAYVTGSNGFLGLNLCAELIRQDWRVLALHRRDSDTRYLDRFAVEKGYLLGGTDASYLDLVKVIGELAGRPVPARTTPAWLLKAVAAAGEFKSVFTGRQPDLTREAATMATRTLSCDCAKARRELGFATVPLRQMAGDCFRWMKQEGRLEA